MGKSDYDSRVTVGNIWPGMVRSKNLEKNFLMAGDAAALSGRFAAKAIGLAQKSGEPVVGLYSGLMRHLVRQTKKNQQAGILSFGSNEELQNYLDKGIIKMGLNMAVQSFLNKIRSAERQVMIP